MNTRGILSSHQKSLDFLQRLIDLLLIAAGWMLFIQDDRHATATLLCLTATCVCFELSSALGGLYASQRSEHLPDLLVRTLVVTTATFVLLACAGFFEPALAGHSGAQSFSLWALFCSAALCGWRVILRSLLQQMRRLGLNTRQAGIVGRGVLARDFAARLDNNAWMGIQVRAIYHDDDPRAENPDASPYLARRLDTLIADARDGKLDMIYLALPAEDIALTRQLQQQLADTTCAVYLVPDLLTRDLLLGRQYLIDGVPVISLYDTPLTPAGKAMKRLLDICVSVVALVLLSPLLTGIALAVKLTSPGPAIFKQDRYGLHGKRIRVWKFRTMTTQDNGQEVQQATRNDSRLTPIGGFLRRSSLDELPQFVNALWGDMSVVGPRPHAVAHNELYRGQIPGYMLRHKVKPGITGWAQINGYRGETDTLEKMTGRIKLDIEYIQTWSLLLDIKIILLTAFKGFFSDNAY